MDGSLEQALRNQIGVAPIRRGGMTVVIHRKRKVPLVLFRRLDYILASTQQLDDGKRNIRKLSRIARTASCKKALKRGCIGCRRQRLAETRGKRHNGVPALGRSKRPP